MSMFRLFSRGKRDKPRPVVILGCAIQDFFVMRGVLFVRGVVERRDEPAMPRMFVRRWDGTLHEAQPRQDPFNPTRPEHWAFHFHHVLPPDTPTADIGRISLVFDFPRDRFIAERVTEPGHARDDYNNSESGFWDAVKANQGRVNRLFARMLEILA